MTAFRLDATDRVWWCDPLAPTKYRSGTTTRTWDGEWMPRADFVAFINAQASGGALIGTVVAGGDMQSTAQVRQSWTPTVNWTRSWKHLRLCG